MVDEEAATRARIRSAIEARIDRTLALEELTWRVHSFVEDVWGPLPEAWTKGVTDLGVALSVGELPDSGLPRSEAWETERARLLRGLDPDDAWLVGLSEHLWEHAFDGARDAVRSAAIEAFVEATMEYIDAHPRVPAVRHR
jgi:hypothetical protein